MHTNLKFISKTVKSIRRFKIYLYSCEIRNEVSATDSAGWLSPWSLLWLVCSGSLSASTHCPTPLSSVHWDPTSIFWIPTNNTIFILYSKTNTTLMMLHINLWKFIYLFTLLLKFNHFCLYDLSKFHILKLSHANFYLKCLSNCSHFLRFLNFKF